MTNEPGSSGGGTPPGTFELFLSREPFRGLKVILDKLCSQPEVLRAAAEIANSYEELISRLGYKLVLTRQIHVQDAFSRQSAAGGIKAVLPYNDVATYSSFPTLIHLDRTVSNTAKGADFFNALFVELKRQSKLQH